MIKAKESPTSFNGLFLAAGFGTRLKELGESLPKGLIPSGQTTIIGHLVEDLRQTPDVDQVALVTNNRFFQQYGSWLKDQHLDNWLKILNDGVNLPEERRGAIGDFIFALDQLNWWDSNILVLPSDTVYRFSLKKFIDFVQSCPNNSLVTVVKSMPLADIKNRLGCAILENNQIIDFVEKPAKPPSSYAAIPFYFYHQPVLAKVKDYYQQFKHADSNQLDAPGKIVPWLITQNVPVFSFITEKQTLDVGVPPDIKKAADFC